MIAGESEEREEDEHREVFPRRRMAHLTGGHEIPDEQRIGDRESEEGLAVRTRGGEQETLSLVDLVAKLATL